MRGPGSGPKVSGFLSHQTSNHGPTYLRVLSVFGLGHPMRLTGPHPKRRPAKEILQMSRILQGSNSPKRANNVNIHLMLRLSVHCLVYVLLGGQDLTVYSPANMLA